MTDIDPKALEHACQCAGRSVHHFDRMALDLSLRASIVAHARAIEQHEAFRQEVSDAIERAFPHGDWAPRSLTPFIIAKPDPLVEAWLEAFPGNYIDDAREECAKISAALAARGLKIVEVGHD
jgi:hypothetical protein